MEGRGKGEVGGALGEEVCKSYCACFLVLGVGTGV